MAFNNHEIETPTCESTLYHLSHTYTENEIEQTLQTEAFKVSNNLDRLAELMVAIDLYVLKHDLGDEMYKKRCAVIERKRLR
jgi:hypothetical protein